MHTVGLTGRDGGAMARQVDLLLNVSASTKTPRIQETHILVGHTICELVDEALFGAGAGAGKPRPVGPRAAAPEHGRPAKVGAARRGLKTTPAAPRPGKSRKAAARRGRRARR
jgi:hypothetical protein